MRTAGPILVALGFVMMVVFLANADEGAGSSRFFWMPFVGVPLLVIGAHLTLFGFQGVIAAYQARETREAVRDAASAAAKGWSGGGGSGGSGGVGCPECGRPADPDARFCDRCGRTLDVAKPSCVRCGRENDADARFCDRCGAALAG